MLWLASVEYSKDHWIFKALVNFMLEIFFYLYVYKKKESWILNISS